MRLSRTPSGMRFQTRSGRDKRSIKASGPLRLYRRTIAGLMGQPRRIAIFDYSIPLVARTAALVITSVIGGLVLLIAAILLIVILVRSHLGERALTKPLRYALAVNPPQQVPAALNGFALWNAVLLAVMVVTYGYPIGQFFFLNSHSVPAVEVTSQESASTGGR